MNATKIAGMMWDCRKRLSSLSDTTDEPTPTQKKKIKFGCEFAENCVPTARADPFLSRARGAAAVGWRRSRLVGAVF
jgi:hypothetical protein